MPVLGVNLEELAAASPGGQIEPVSIPSGWTPSVAYHPDGTAEVISLGPGTPDESTWADEVRALGVHLEPGFVVRLAEIRHDPGAWVRRGQGLDAETEPITRRRYVIEPARTRLDLDELVAAIGRPRKRPTVTGGEWAYVHAVADWQLGKASATEGSADTVERILGALDRSVDRLKAERKRRPIGTVFLPALGDLCEGVVSAKGAILLSSDLGMTEAIRVVRRLLLEHVKAFAPLVDRLVVTSVPGNHDQPHRVLGASPRGDDSWAVDAAMQVADALQLAGGYDHVEIITPAPDELTVTVEVAGSRIACAHGHQIRKGRAHEWWSRQAHSGDRRLAGASMLLTGHFHHLAVEVDGPRVWLQAPTVDPGSPGYSQRYGGQGPGGVLTFLTSDNAWAGLEIL